MNGRNIMKEIEYVHYWSDDIPQKAKEDLFFVENEVFGLFYSERYYHKKFIENIYGKSLITIVYVDGVPSGADILWRNDINGIEAYQTVDTCVVENCRGMGIFTEITKREIDFFGKNVMLYGYPNRNSAPGYVKMEWDIKQVYISVLIYISKYIRLQSHKIDRDYAQWWMMQGERLFYIKKFGHYLLVRKRKNKPICYVLGVLAEDAVELFARTSSLCVLTASFYEPKFISFAKSIVVSLRCRECVDIPLWKIDAV